MLAGLGLGGVAGGEAEQAAADEQLGDSKPYYIAKETYYLVKETYYTAKEIKQLGDALPSSLPFSAVVMLVMQML